MDQGRYGHIGFGKESSWGAGVAPTVFLPGTEDLSPDRDRLVIEDPHASRFDLPSKAGRMRIQGKNTSGHPLYTDSIGLILLGLFGQVATSGTAAPYTHTFSPLNAPLTALNALPPISVQVTAGSRTKRFVGGQIASFSLNQPKDDFAKFDLGWHFKDVDTSQSAATPAIPNEDIYAFRHLAITRDGNPVTTVESLTLNIDNQLEGEELLDGSDRVSAIGFGGLAITVDLTLAFRDTNAYDQFYNDLASAWAFKWTLGANSLEFLLPKAVVASFSDPLSGPGRLTATAQLKGEYDSASGYALQATLVNSTASY